MQAEPERHRLAPRIFDRQRHRKRRLLERISKRCAIGVGLGPLALERERRMRVAALDDVPAAQPAVAVDRQRLAAPITRHGELAPLELEACTADSIRKRHERIACQRVGIRIEPRARAAAENRRRRTAVSMPLEARHGATERRREIDAQQIVGERQLGALTRSSRPAGDRGRARTRPNRLHDRRQFRRARSRARAGGLGRARAPRGDDIGIRCAHDPLHREAPGRTWPARQYAKGSIAAFDHR
jgi:hypothetical protein